MRIDPSKRNPVRNALADPVAELGPDPGEVESFVPDGRSLLRPAQVVEGRVFEVLQRAPVLVSQFDRPARPRYR
jgi:hypothetical protein